MNQQQNSQPRLLTRAQAAVHCGLSPEGFSDWVRRETVPGSLPGTQRYDRLTLDQALDRLSRLDHKEVGPV